MPLTTLGFRVQYSSPPILGFITAKWRLHKTGLRGLLSGIKRGNAGKEFTIVLGSKAIWLPPPPKLLLLKSRVKSQNSDSLFHLHPKLFNIIWNDPLWNEEVMEKETRKTRSQINVSSERKMSPFSPDSKQSTHSWQQEIDRKGGRGRGKGGKGGEGKKERGREDREKGRKRRRRKKWWNLLTDLITKIQTEATLIHPFFF